MSIEAKRPNVLVLENYIGGKFVPCAKHIDTFDPSTGEVYCKVPDSGPKEVRFLTFCVKKFYTRISKTISTNHYKSLMMFLLQFYL